MLHSCPLFLLSSLKPDNPSLLSFRDGIPPTNTFHMKQPWQQPNTVPSLFPTSAPPPPFYLCPMIIEPYSPRPESWRKINSNVIASDWVLTVRPHAPIPCMQFNGSLIFWWLMSSLDLLRARLRESSEPIAKYPLFQSIYMKYRPLKTTFQGVFMS